MRSKIQMKNIHLQSKRTSQLKVVLKILIQAESTKLVLFKKILYENTF